MDNTVDSLELIEKKLSKWDRLKIIVKGITIEPVTLIMLTGLVLSSTAIQTLVIEKACRVDLNLTEEVCDALRRQDSDSNPENERLVQEYIAPYISYKSIITSVLPCLLLVFAGGWMDLTGRRKIMMVVPVFGQILLEINNIINVIFFNQLNVIVLIFTESIMTMFGSFNVLVLAVFSFITDITTEKDRTYRLGLVSFGIYIGMPIGVSLSGVLLRNYGYISVFGTALCMASFNAVYIIFKLRDPPRTSEHKKHDNRGVLYFTKSFFSPVHFLNSLKVVFKKTSTNRRIMLCFLIATACFVLGPYQGESSVMYLSTRYRFNWDEFQYSMFQTLNLISTTIGNMFSILLLSKKLGWHDAVLGIISMISKIAASFFFCFATNGTVFFMGPVVDLFNGTGALAVRSILSKSVEREEISRLTSIISIAEVLTPMAFVSLYVNVYTHTMEWMSGFVFLLTAVISLFPLMVFLCLFYRHRRTASTYAVKKTGENAS